MADIKSTDARSKNMAAIKEKDTKPELLIRKALHAKGFRYRLHDKKLPGKPDLVLKKYNAVIFIHGCFWHKHDCHLFKWPSTREEFWKLKINQNAERDRKITKEIIMLGYRLLIIWECSIKGKNKHDFYTILSEIDNWLNSDENFKEIKGK